ncbi:MAG TPA: four helix bundle protein [Solimonas sp.]|nr:four helix bundle protein [Solimonas sp.]
MWQKAMGLVELTYRLSRAFPSEERYGLTSQVRRSAVSVPSNIAEGQGRGSAGEFRQFLGNARGSLYEVETQMRLATMLGFLSEANAEHFFALSEEVAKLLNALRQSLATTNN